MKKIIAIYLLSISLVYGENKAFQEKKEETAKFLKNNLKNKVKPKTIDDALKQIEDQLLLPAMGVLMVKTPEKTFFVTTNGRFVFTGKVYDNWNKEFLTTIEEAREKATKVDLDKLKLDIDILNPIIIGKGKKEIVVFVEPYCAVCNTLIREIKSNKNNVQKKFTFKIVSIASSNDASKNANAKLHCLNTKDKPAAMEALIDQKYKRIKYTKNCGQQYEIQSQLVSQVLGAVGTPYTIADDGRVVMGKNKDYFNWLENK